MESSQSILKRRCKILFEDEELYVIHKPEGFRTHPADHVRQDKLSISSGIYDPNTETFDTGVAKLFLVHRLDQDTSGVLIIAKNKATQAFIREQFRLRTIQKSYSALVFGLIRQSQTWSDHIERSNQKAKTCKDKSKNARTELEVRRIDEKNAITQITLKPSSGRFHQLRVQCSKRHLPIIGDRRYGDFKKNKWFATEYGIRRLLLHAESIAFKHPKTNKVIQVTSPLPDDFDYLNNH